MLGPNELELLYTGTYRMDCPVLELHITKDEFTHKIIGPGSIWQGNDGSLFFELFYTWKEDDVIPLLEPLARNKHMLAATDILGRRWWSESAYEGPNSYHGTSTQFSVVRGRLYQLNYSYQLTASEGEWIRLYHNTDISIPFKTSYNFEIAGYSISINYEEAKTRLEAVIAPVANNNLADHVTDTFIHSLQFACGTMVRWLVKAERRTDLFILTIFGTGWFKPSLKTLPPISLTLDNEEDFKDLLTAYWNKEASHQGDEPYPITAWLTSILFTERGLVETEIAMLCLALEGMAKLIDSSQVRVWLPEMEETVNMVVAMMKRSATETMPNLNPEQKKDVDSLRDRIINTVSNLRHLNTTAILSYLADHQVITPNQLKYWRNYRHRLAHGNLLTEPISELFTAKRTLLTAFYRISFYVLGYSGSFQNWELDNVQRVKFEHTIPS